MAETKNQVATTTFKTSLQKAQEGYMLSVESSLANSGIELNDYQKQCGILALSKMNDVINQSKKTFKELDQSSITGALTQVLLTETNLASYPPEGYLTIKGDKMTFDTQGEGWRTLAEKYGRNVQSISEPWLVREGDTFKMPKYVGNGVTPPEWEPSFPQKGKVVLVVYGVKKKDGSMEWLFSSREDVKVNLLSHIQNNLCRGFNKNEALYTQILKKTDNMTLDEILLDPEICREGIVSPAWRGPARENMIIRKMKNNVLKNYPKDYKSTIVATALSNMGDGDNLGVVDVSGRNADETTPTKVEEEIQSINGPSVADFEEPTKPQKEEVKVEAPKKEEKKASSDFDDMPF